MNALNWVGNVLMPLLAAYNVVRGVLQPEMKHFQVCMIDFTTSSLLFGCLSVSGILRLLEHFVTTAKPSRTSSSTSTSPRYPLILRVAQFPATSCANHALRPGVRGSDGHRPCGCGRDGCWDEGLAFSSRIGICSFCRWNWQLSVDCGLFQRSCAKCLLKYGKPRGYTAALFNGIQSATRLLMP